MEVEATKKNRLAIKKKSCSQNAAEEGGSSQYMCTCDCPQCMFGEHMCKFADLQRAKRVAFVSISPKPEAENYDTRRDFLTETQDHPLVQLRTRASI